MTTDPRALARRIITEEVEREGYRVLRIILFGSRARGDARPDSDWDFLVVVDREIPRPLERYIRLRIRRMFVKHGFWGDILFETPERLEKQRNNPGFLTYYVLREGVEL